MNKIENRCSKITLSEKYASFALPTVLLFTDYFAIVIAEAVSYFIRKFKENYKCSPSEYRRKFKVY